MLKKILLMLVLFISAQCFCFAQSSIFVPNVTKKQITDALVKDRIEHNWNVATQTDYSISFYKKSDSAGYSYSYNTDNNNVTDKLQYNIVESNGGVTIAVAGQTVTRNSGSTTQSDTYTNTGYNKTTTTTSNSTTEDYTQSKIDDEIEYLRRLFVGYYTYWVQYGKMLKLVHVQYVEPNSTAYRDGLRARYIITKINGWPVENMDRSQINNSYNPEKAGQKLSLEYKTDKNATNTNTVTIYSVKVKPLIEFNNTKK